MSRYWLLIPLFILASLSFWMTSPVEQVDVVSETPVWPSSNAQHQGCSHTNGTVFDHTRTFPEARRMQQGVGFDISYVNFNQEQIDAFEFAASIWSSILDSDVDIKINVTLINFPGFLGFAIPNGDKNFTGAPMADIIYPTSLANALAGFDTKPMDNDIEIYISTIANWYYGLDANPAPNQIDFVTVAIHEIAHGLGFIETVQENVDSIQYGFLMADDLILPTSFELDDQEGDPFIYSTFLENAGGESMLNTNLFPNNSLELASFVTSPVFFDGPNTLIANGGTRARIYSPPSFAFGSSIVHLNESTYPAGSGNAMMTPFVSSGEGNHDPGPLMIAILQDLGWPLVDPSTSLEEPTEEEVAFTLFPNPSRGRYQFDTDIGELQYRVFSAEGKMVSQGQTIGQALNIHHLPEGQYTIHLFKDDFEVVRPVLKF